MNSSKYLNAVLTCIAVLLGLNLWTGLHQSPGAQALDPATTAHAQGRTDAGQQRVEMIRKLGELVDAVEANNDKLDALDKLDGLEGLDGIATAVEEVNETLERVVARDRNGQRSIRVQSAD